MKLINIKYYVFFRRVKHLPNGITLPVYFGKIFFK